MGQYDKKIETAQRLIERFGERATVRLLTEPSGAGAQPWKPTAGTPSHNDVGDQDLVLLPLDGRPGLRYGDGSEVKAGDKLLYAPASVPLQLGCLIIRASGQVWKVMALQPLDVGGSVILYEGVVSQ